MQLISVDIGNSSIKLAVEQSKASKRWSTITTIRNSDPIAIELVDEPAFWSVCSVNRDRHNDLQDWVRRNRSQDHWHLIDESEISLKSNVESRAEVGRDRLLGAWMAFRLNDDVGPIAIVDAGTAVTVDLVDANGRFQGGTIFPGTATSLKYLSGSTDALPDLSDRSFMELLGDIRHDVLGKSTHEAILRGVFQAQIGSILHITDLLRKQTSDDLEVYATGGGISDLQRGMPTSWNFVPDLVLQGANRIGRKLMKANESSI